jgi:hypothetical protein
MYIDFYVVFSNINIGPRNIENPNESDRIVKKHAPAPTLVCKQSHTTGSYVSPSSKPPPSLPFRSLSIACEHPTRTHEHSKSRGNNGGA